ncbi:rRNA methyltransferase 3, mitochondrial-like [Acanthaster planci]|uniref:rRNA methyltransferase 3, mitochondrial-like n=1 Tax=Acanthaster planci TaxID=133434 RepID=A0A8B7Y3E7_ACAPL|nr:rRNA methyltransferase 3, mitochondrial-like [Acanthaster planci]
MAAPKRSLMLVLAKLSIPQNTCLRQSIPMSPNRSFAVTSVDMIRGFRGSDIKAGPKNRKSNQRNAIDTIEHVELSEDVDGNLRNTSVRNLPKQSPMKSSVAAEGDVSKLNYEKAGVDDKRIGRLMMLAKSRKLRDQKGRVMLEGRRLITDAIESGLQAHTIFFSRLENLQGIPVNKTRATLVKVPFKDITMWSDVVTTQGVIGVFQKPTFTSMHQSESLILPLTLICDNIREPGNLGTILRSAVAAQCEKILLTKGCVDLWEPKVLRSGAGAHFCVPIIANIPWKEMPNYVDENVTIHVAENNVSVEELPESNTPRRFHYPGKPHGHEQEEWNQDLSDDADLSDQVLESRIYHEVDWRVRSALVIGGETEGLSDRALEMCDRSSGYRVHIPMPGLMESLNSAISASVIIFEALRQNMTLEKS